MVYCKFKKPSYFSIGKKNLFECFREAQAAEGGGGLVVRVARPDSGEGLLALGRRAEVLRIHDVYGLEPRLLLPLLLVHLRLPGHHTHQAQVQLLLGLAGTVGAHNYYTESK